VGLTKIGQMTPSGRPTCPSLVWLCAKPSARRRAGVPLGSQEVIDDPDLIAFEPNPKSRVGASRFIGESPTAGTVLVVIAYHDLDGDLHGVKAWPATGPERELYRREADGGQDD